MAYNGYLIKFGGHNGDALPMKFIAIGNYKSTPNQRMESKADRSITGILHRTTVEHTATKIEFVTPVITNRDVYELNNLYSSHFINQRERKIDIEYYDQETDSYKVATCYMPDIAYSIDHINSATNTIYYDGIRLAIIEY